MEKYSNMEFLKKEIEKIYLQKGEISEGDWNRIIRKCKKDDGNTPSKNYILEYIKKEKIKIDEGILKEIIMKPTRTISGVTPITIFTKPYKCSGNCIFCPTSKETPKSYLTQEPGIQRAIYFKYDPYEQIKGRIKALKSIGHNTSKIELIISGGTWDDYSLNYKIWYILETLRALNNLPSEKYLSEKKYSDEYFLKELEKLKNKNQNSETKNVGICIETRPDKIDVENIKWYRKFGITKIQIGIQTLNEKILKANNRGHTVQDSYNAINMLRQAGFKIHIHWMCNLYTSSPEKDYKDFKEIFTNKNIKPDEIKIYPCSIVKDTELYKLFQNKKYSPYNYEELTNLLIKCKTIIPNYCRINRLIRDIPSDLIIEGNKITNLRQKIQEIMKEKKLKCDCIRCREIKNQKYDKLNMKITKYETNISKEYFLEYVTDENKIAGFLRLSVYKNKKSLLIDVPAMIRELHIYGTSLNLKEKSKLSSQHSGLGTKLILKAEEIVKKEKMKKIGVISAIGTRKYYKEKNYVLENNYGYLVKNV